MKLKNIRNDLEITAKTASDVTNVPLRTYLRYEKDDNYGDALKREAIINALKSKYEITEEKGLLNIQKITNVCNSVFKEYKNNIEFCYLFGSYAKGYATEKSDIDLCISTSLTGLKFVGLVEKLRNKLHKNVDVIRTSELTNNEDLLKEIMKDGIKIYE